MATSRFFFQSVPCDRGLLVCRRDCLLAQMRGMNRDRVLVLLWFGGLQIALPVIRAPGCCLPAIAQARGTLWPTAVVWPSSTISEILIATPLQQYTRINVGIVRGYIMLTARLLYAVALLVARVSHAEGV